MKSAKYRKIYKALKQLARNIQFINRHSNYEVIGLILKYNKVELKSHQLINVLQYFYYI